MEDLVLGALGLVSSAIHWGLSNAIPLAVGAVLGGPLGHAALGMVGDVLSRTKEVVDSIGSAISGKK